MRRLKRLLLVLILIPFCFSFASCKDKSEEPETGGGGGSSDKNEIVSTESFSVAYDYNLPEKYDFLLSDYTSSGNSVGSIVQLDSIPDENLSKYFLGWYDENDSKVNGTVSSDIATTINLKAKWNEEDIDKYYYTKGLTFFISGDDASVIRYSGSASKIVLPKLFVSDSKEYNVSSISDSVFEEKNISSLIVNAEELSIGKSAFKNSNLKEFDFEIVSEIGESAFEGTKISEVKFSSNLTSVGARSFKSCLKLKSLDFSSLEFDILDETFYGCVELSSIKNAENIVSIQDYSFANCSKLRNTLFLGANLQINSLGRGSFLNCVGIEEIFIPESVLSVLQPFEGCTNVNKITLSRTYAVETNGSDRLTYQLGDISESVKEIVFAGSSASRLLKNYFYGFENLESFVMSNSIMYLDDNAFKYCVNLKDITLSSSLVLENFTYKAFSGTKFLNERTEPLIFKGAIIYVPDELVAEYQIPNTVTRINESVFANKTKLEKITIPATVETIGKSAFEGCSNLTEVVFEQNDNITKLEDSTFNQCVRLNKIDLTKLTSLLEIGSETFRNTAFTNFIIPETITNIGIGAFMKTPLISFEVSGDGGDYFVENGILYKDISADGDKSSLMLCAYPIEKTEAIFVCPNNVTEIASYAFSWVNNLDYVYFAQDSMDWEESTSATGEPVYTSFSNTSGIVVLREKSSFNINFEEVFVYTQVVSADCAWNYDENEIEILNDFVPDTENCFLQVIEQDTSVSIVIFDFDFTNKIIVEDSVVKIENFFD